MAPGEATRLYHHLTSYAHDRHWMTPIEDARVLQHFVPNDLDALPPPCKEYPAGLRTVLLPRECPRVAGTPARAGHQHTDRGVLDAASLGRLLHLSAGVVRVQELRRQRVLFRAAPSAGGRFPLEVYVSARGVIGVPDGVHWYDPIQHALVRVGAAANGDATAVVVTGVPWRTGWRYAERGLRHIYWDAGTMLAQMLAVADSVGLAPRLWTRFCDADVARLTGADGVHEFPVAVLGFGDGAPAIQPRSEAQGGVVDANPVEFPLVTRAQQAGDCDELGEPWSRRRPFEEALPTAEPLDDVILRRGSARLLERGAHVSRDAFDRLLGAGLCGTALTYFIAVQAVEGLLPGIYRWPEFAEPEHPGDYRDELFHVCLDQDLARDAGFIAIATVDMRQLHDRAYREVNLEAGIVSGRLNLGAAALGLGATGITFIDSDIPVLLGEPVAGLLLTCVGVLPYRSRAGGPPGSPVVVVTPTRRQSARK